jgi:hypothetical protein
MTTGAHLEGDDELIHKLRYPGWAAAPMRSFFDRWRFATERGTKANIKRGPGGWLWKADTRRSFTSETDPAKFPHWARVGSMTARWGDFGTGILSEDPESAKTRYFPPIEAVQQWADDHDKIAYFVALGIYERGGIAPRRFLREAAKASSGRIDGWVAQAADEMEGLAGGTV